MKPSQNGRGSHKSRRLVGAVLRGGWRRRGFRITKGEEKKNGPEAECAGVHQGAKGWLGAGLSNAESTGLAWRGRTVSEAADAGELFQSDTLPPEMGSYFRIHIQSSQERAERWLGGGRSARTERLTQNIFFVTLTPNPYHAAFCQQNQYFLLSESSQINDAETIFNWAIYYLREISSDDPVLRILPNVQEDWVIYWCVRLQTRSQFLQP